MSSSFRTEFDISKSEWSIDHSDNILTIGSCFSDDIGNKLTKLKFRSLANPFGTVYNPVSIGNLINWSLKGSSIEQGFVANNGIHANLHFHSSFNDLVDKTNRDLISDSIRNVHEYLSQTSYIIVTLGTAWVYKHLTSNEIVSNCHKISSKEFSKELLSSKLVINKLEETFKNLLLSYPQIKIILTVSPVRHLRDGIEMNAVSKSILRIASYHLSQHHTQIDYFPAYEIILDDLRDYRYYSDDMIHPGNNAITYVWEKFSQKYFNASTIALNKELGDLQRALAHKPFVPQSSKHLTFLEETLLKLKVLNEKVNLQIEINDVEEQLTNIRKR